VTNGIHVKSANSVVLKDLIEWGSSNSAGVGLLVDGSVAFTSVKLITPDIEIFGTCISSTGNVSMDVVSPYSENCALNYNHAISGGMVNIVGGSLETASGGNGINIAGDNLSIRGTNILPGTGGTGITATSPVPFRNVQLQGIPGMSSISGFFGSGTNLLNLGFVQPSLVNDLYHQTYDFVKTPTSGTATQILNLNNFANFAKFKLTVMATIGAAVAIKQFDFAITSQNITGSTDPILTTLSSFTNGNWGLSLGNATLTASGNDIVVSITSSTSGTLGAGHNPTLYCSLEVFAYSSTNTGAVVLD